MSLENIITIVVGVISITIPIYILIKGTNREASFIYGILGLLAGPLWAVSLVLFRESSELDIALFWDRIIYFDATIIAPLFFRFANTFPRKRKVNFFVHLVIYSLGAFFLHQVFFSNNFISQIILNDSGNSIKIGSVYYIWLFWFCLLMGAGVIIMIREYFNLSGALRDQAKYIVLGAILPALGTLPTNAIFPAFGVYQYIWIGPFFLIGMNVVVAYGLTRTRFWGRSLFVRYVFRPCMLFLSIFLSIELAIWILVYADVLSLSVHMIYIALFAVFVTTIFLIVDYFIRVKILPLIGGYVDPIKTRDDFLIKTASELDVDTIGSIFSSTVKDIFQTRLAGIIAVDQNDGQKVFYEKIGTIPTDELLLFLHSIEEWGGRNKSGNLVVLSELEYYMIGSLDFVRNNELLKLMSFMKKYALEVVIPIDKKVNIAGLCFIGNKEKGKSYTVEDIDLLKVIVSTASVALSRAILYKEVKGFAKTLEKKVELATSQLKDKVEALEEARRLERDMVDIMGHELRTPISIVKGSFLFLMTIFDKYKRKGIFDNDNKKINEYIDRINENVDREIRLLETFLSATKVDKDVMELSREKVDIIDVIEDGIVGQESKAKHKNITLKFNKPGEYKSYPFVFADRVRIQEVVDNLINNAVKYTEKGEVVVDIEKDEKFVTVHVKDTGIGIPESEIKNLGKKFYRIQQYTQESMGRDLKIVRAGGTGLGLYVTFGIINRHGGKIWVTSKKDKGSTFHFSIPIYRGEIEDISANDAAVTDVFKRLGLK